MPKLAYGCIHRGSSVSKSASQHHISVLKQFYIFVWPTVWVLFPARSVGRGMSFFLGRPWKFREIQKHLSTRNLPSIFPTDDVRHMTLPSLLKDISQTSSKRQHSFLYEFVYSIKKLSGKKLLNQFLLTSLTY